MPGKAGVLVVSDDVNAPLFRSVGLEVETVGGPEEVPRVLRASASKGYALVIVLKHLVEDEDGLKREATRLGVPLLVLPTLKARAEPINVEKILAKALGLG